MFLDHLAAKKRVSASTQNQVLAALLFLYPMLLRGISKPAPCHSLRHPLATHLLEQGAEIRTIEELLGHSDVKTATIDTHVLNRGPSGVLSPSGLL